MDKKTKEKLESIGMFIAGTIVGLVPLIVAILLR
jgi:hypothetical protein